jgi:hypothetical protein
MGIPTNAADAAAAIRDNVLGVIENILIGELLVDALTGLDNPESIIVTKKPVEQGFEVTEAAVDAYEPMTLDIALTNPTLSAANGLNAIVTGDPASLVATWRDKRDELYQMMRDREIIDVQTHENLYQSWLITNITPIWDVEENYDAFFATVTFEKYDTKGSTDDSGGILDSALEAVGGL